MHSEARFDAYYFYGPTFDHILDGFTEITGRPKMLPRWAIGIGDASAYRQLNDTRDQGGNPSNAQNVGSETSGNYQPWQTPFGGFWFDRGTVGVVDSYINEYLNKDTPVSWFLPNDGYGCEYNKYTHPSGGLDVLGRELRKYGIRFGLWVGQPAKYTSANYTYGYPPSATTNDSRAPYFNEELKNQVLSGARVYKVDVAWSSGKSGNKGPMACYRRLIENIEKYSKTDENPDGERGFVIAVYGWTGVQRYSTVWSGDQMGTLDYTAYHIPTFTGAGMSGFPYSFNDQAAIYADYPGVYVRDLQSKTLMPLNYAMSNWGNRVSYAEIDKAWAAAGNRQDAGPNATTEFPPNGLRASADKRPSSEYHHTDEELDINHKYLMLKQQLVPYIYSYIQYSAKTGAPLVRPMVYNFQNDVNTYGKATQYQYMTGDWLMAAPVIFANDTTRENIYLPEGRWIDYWTGDNYYGPDVISMDAPYDIMPMFARAGAIVPMSQEYIYDGQEYYTDKNGKTIKVNDTLILDIYPEGKTSFDLYEDDGYTLKYETKDEYTFTNITSDAPVSGVGPLTVTIGAATGKGFIGQVDARKNLLTIHTAAKPGVVKVGDMALSAFNNLEALKNLEDNRGGWFFDENDRGGILYVRTPMRLTDAETVVWVDTCVVPTKTELTDLSLPLPQNVKIAAIEDDVRPRFTSANQATLMAAVAGAKLEVTWDAVPGAKYYEVEIDGETIVKSSNTTFLHDKLTNVSSHTYRVRAFGLTGASAWTTPVRGTTKPARVRVPNGAPMTATWSQSDSNGVIFPLANGSGTVANLVNFADTAVTASSSNVALSAVVAGEVPAGNKPNLDVSLGREYLISSIDYMPITTLITGTVWETKIFTSMDGVNYTPVTIVDAYGNPTGSKDGFSVFRNLTGYIWTTSFEPVVAKYVRIQQQTTNLNRFTTTFGGRYVWIYQAGAIDAAGDLSVNAESVTLSAESAALAVGETLNLTATVAPENTYNKNVVFTSSDEMVATVSPTGKVTAMGSGKAIITAYSLGKKDVSASCALTVTGTPVEALTIVGSDETLYAGIGEAYQLVTTYVPPEATNVKIAWASGDDSAVSVSKDGFITVLQYNDEPVAITATIIDGAPPVSDSFTVQPVDVTELAVDNTLGTLTATFSAFPTNLRDYFAATYDDGLGVKALTVSQVSAADKKVVFSYKPFTEAIGKTDVIVTLRYKDGAARSASVTGLTQVVTVTFSGAGADADASPAVITVVPGGTVSLPTPPMKIGYNFAGWVDGAGDAFVADAPIDSDLIVYATWTPQTRNVSFNWGTGDPTVVAFDFDGLIQAPATIARPGYRLTGWFRNYQLSIPWDFANDVLKANEILYAQWTPEFTVTFNSNGGSAVSALSGILSGTRITEPVPTKASSIFTGWYVDAACTTLWQFTTNAVTKNITLYAGWATSNRVTVNFEVNGGSKISAVTRQVGNTIGYVMNPTKARDVFVGWYIDSALTKPWYPELNRISGNMTLYAKWASLSDTLFTYDFNSASDLERTGAYGVSSMNGVSIDFNEGVGNTKGALKFDSYLRDPALVTDILPSPIESTSYLRLDANNFQYGNAKTFTLTMWIKPENVLRQQQLFSAAPNGTNYNDWLILRSYGIPGTTERGGYLGQFRLGDSFITEGSFNLYAGIPVEPIRANEWTMVTVSVGVDKVRYYINGQNMGQTNSAAWSGTATSFFSLGGRSINTTADGCFSGWMDDVRFFNAALTDSQIKELYDSYSYQSTEEKLEAMKISVPAPNLTLKKGSTYDLGAAVTITPTDSAALLSYASSNASVVSVNDKGVLYGLKTGTAVITVKDSLTGVSVAVIVTVK